MDRERPQHPSGKPIRTRGYVRLPIPRLPPDEPLTPGLRRPWRTEAIGFGIATTNDRDDD